MLLDPHPKKTITDLYNRVEEIRELSKSISSEMMTVIAAPRRMGKTSLLNACLSSLGKPYLMIDGRVLYSKGVTSFNLLESIGEGLNSMIPTYPELIEHFRTEGVLVEGLSLRFDYRKISIVEVMRRIDRFAGQAKKRFVIAVDEAQYFKFGKRLSKRINALLAYCMDELPGLSFALTGSEVGVLHDFLGLDDPKAPLFGRMVKILTLRGFSSEESLDFLEKGLTEIGVSYDRGVLENAVSKLDGIVGWLTHFGYAYAEERVDVSEFVKKAMKMVQGELQELYKKSDRYRLILETIAGGLRKRSDVYRSIAIQLGPISRSDFSYLLENLVKMNFVEKRGRIHHTRSHHRRGFEGLAWLAHCYPNEVKRLERYFQNKHWVT